MVSLSLALVIGLVAVALTFDFLNGVHDAANSIATVVSTRVLLPHTGAHTSALVPLRAWKVAEDAYLLHRHPPYAD